MAIERHTAIHCNLKHILEGEFVRGEGWNPSYVVSAAGDLKRVNVIGLVVQVLEPGVAIIDDGTARIEMRYNDQELGIGDTTLVVGRPRDQQGDRFLYAEILKLLPDSAWLELRKKELATIPDRVIEVKREEPKVNEERAKELERAKEESVHDQIAMVIKSLDSGTGADVDEVLERIDIKNSEQILNSMKERGEVFEIKPGMVKVLE